MTIALVVYFIFLIVILGAWVWSFRVRCLPRTVLKREEGNIKEYETVKAGGDVGDYILFMGIVITMAVLALLVILGKLPA